MNPINLKLVSSFGNSRIRFRLLSIMAGRAGKLAACLMLGVASLSQSARSAPYDTAVLADSPVAYWPLNELDDPRTGAALAHDISGNGHNGTYGVDAVNGIYGYYAPTYPGFASGEGAVYSAAGDVNSSIKISALSPLNLNTNTVTIAMWIDPYGGQVNYTGLLMNRAAGDASGFGFGANPDANGMPAMGYTWNQNNGNTYNWNSLLHAQAYMWQFVALVVTSNSATIYLFYIDPSTGQPVLKSAVNNVAHTAEKFDSTGGLYLNSDANGTTVGLANNVFNGEMSSAAVFNKSLTSDQVLSLFASALGVSGFAPSITYQPTSLYVTSGSKAVFSAVGVNGTGPISYQWQLNGTNVNLRPDSANYTGANSNILTVVSASPTDVGTYQLVLNNSISTTYSSNAVLAIQAPALLGHWLDGSDASTNFADVSGYSLAASHGAWIQGGGGYVFTNDVPPGKTGKSLLLYD